MKTIRIVAADDSAMKRRLLENMFALKGASAAVPMELCAAVPDGASCLHAVRIQRPDMVLLDLNMPGFGGMETIVRLRREWPKLPIIMCSSATEDGATATLDALAFGASDYVTKPFGCRSAEQAADALFSQLAPRIMALTAKANAMPLRAERYSDVAPGSRTKVEAVGIGVSTGGPAALEELLSRLPENFPAPILIVQHMPKLFTSALATRLDHLCAIRVKQATAGAALRPGTAWIAPGDSHLEVKPGAHGLPFMVLHQGERVNGCRPSVDVLFRSMANTFGSGAAGLVLTGMGSDGVDGAAEIVSAGGVVMAQDQASSAVWGMPGRVVSAGLADAVLPLEGMAEELMMLTRMQRGMKPVAAAPLERSVRYGNW